MDLQAFWNDILKQNKENIFGYFCSDATIYWHCTNEAFTVSEFIRANCAYPGQWDGELERIEHSENSIITVMRIFPMDRLSSFHVVSFFMLKDGLIQTLDEYWSDDGEAPIWRKNMRIGKPIF